jgi:hypothetical protein
MLQPLLRRTRSCLEAYFLDRFSGWWTGISFNSRFSAPKVAEDVSSTESSPSRTRNAHVHSELASLRGSRSDGAVTVQRNGNRDGGGNGDGNGNRNNSNRGGSRLASRIRDLWRAGSPLGSGSSQAEFVELASNPSSVSVAGFRSGSGPRSESRSLRSEVEDRPFMPLRGLDGSRHKGSNYYVHCCGPKIKAGSSPHKVE